MRDVVAYDHLFIERRTLGEKTDSLANLVWALDSINVADHDRTGARAKIAGKDSQGGCFSGTVQTEEADGFRRLRSRTRPAQAHAWNRSILKDSGHVS